jgi:hypothetical protein
MMSFGGNEMNVGFTRRIMSSIHSRNTSRLRPDHAVRLNTRLAMYDAQAAHTNSFGGGEVGDEVMHARGGELRGAESMAKSARAAGNYFVDLSDARKSKSRLDPDRPSRKDVKNAYRDYEELDKFSGLGSQSYGMVEHTGSDAPPGATGSSTINQAPLRNTPGPVMKKALPAARAAGKAVGKRRAAKAAE